MVSQLGYRTLQVEVGAWLGMDTWMCALIDVTWTAR